VRLSAIIAQLQLTFQTVYASQAAIMCLLISRLDLAVIVARINAKKNFTNKACALTTRLFALEEAIAAFLSALRNK
jgi:hypothetical protein